MKNKIIALLLLVVMVTTVFAGCSKKTYNYAEENLSDYVSIVGGEEGLLKALQEIKIADGSFTTNEDTRKKKVTESIYSALATYAQNKRDKLTEGNLDLNDTLYYAYYVTYEKDGVTYAYDVDEYMKETSSPKNSIKLSTVDVNDAKANKLSVAIKNAIMAYGTTGEGENATFNPVAIKGYKTNSSTTVAITKDAFKSVYVSFTRYDKADPDTTKEVANCVKINLHATEGIEKQIADVLLNTNNTVKIGSIVKVKLSETDLSSNFDVIDGEKTYTYTNFKILFAVEEEGNEITFDYKTTAKVELTSTKMDQLHTENAAKVELPVDTTVKYHIFPVYFYNVSEINAKSILFEALGSKITSTSLDVFSDEGYKVGDKTVKALVEELVKIYADNTDTVIKDLKSKFDAAEKAFTSAKTAYNAARKAYYDKLEANILAAERTARDEAEAAYDAAQLIVTEKGENATTEEIADRDAKKAAFDAAQKVITDKLEVAASTDAERADRDAKKAAYEAAQAIVAEKGENATDAEKKARDDAKAAFDAAQKVITDKVEASATAEKSTKDQTKTAYDKAVEEKVSTKTAWETARDAAEKKIDEILTATKENDDKGFQATVVEQHRENEYHTLKEKYDSEIVQNVGKEIWAIIQKNVVVSGYPEELIEETIAHLENQYEYEFNTGTNKDTGKTYYEEYEDNGGFDAFLKSQLEKDGSLEKQAKDLVTPVMQIYTAAKALKSEADTKMKAQVEANKFLYSEEKTGDLDYSEYDLKIFFAEHFYFDDAAFKDYKKLVGKKNVEQNADYYGESNIRTAIQVTNIFDYLLMANRVEVKDGDHSHYEYKYTEDGKYLDFINIKYSIKDETTSSDSE